MTSTGQNNALIQGNIQEISHAPGRPSKRFSCEKKYKATQWALNLIPIPVHKMMNRWTEAELRVLDVIAKNYNYNANHLKASGQYLANISLISRRQFYNIIKKFEKYGLISVIRKKNAAKKTQEINNYVLAKSVAIRYEEAIKKFKLWMSERTQLDYKNREINTKGRNNKYKPSKDKNKNVSFLSDFDDTLATHFKSRGKSISQILHIQSSKNKLHTSCEKKSAKSEQRNPFRDTYGMGDFFDETCAKARKSCKVKETSLSNAPMLVGDKQQQTTGGTRCKARQAGEIRNFSAILERLSQDITPEFLKNFCGGVKILNPKFDNLAADLRSSEFGLIEGEKDHKATKILQIVGQIRRHYFRDLSKDRLFSYLERKPCIAILALLETALKVKLKQDIRVPAAYFAGILKQENPRPDISINYLIYDVEATKNQPIERTDRPHSGHRYLLDQAMAWLAQFDKEIQQKL